MGVIRMKNCTPPINEDHVLDLHDEYSAAKTCGYDIDQILRSFDAQRIAARMRGISSIAAVLQVENGTSSCRLGDYIRGGMIEAIDALAGDVQDILERSNDRAHAAAQQAEKRGV